MLERLRRRTISISVSWYRDTALGQLSLTHQAIYLRLLALVGEQGYGDRERNEIYLPNISRRFLGKILEIDRKTLGNFLENSQKLHLLTMGKSPHPELIPDKEHEFTITICGFYTYNDWDGFKRWGKSPHPKGAQNPHPSTTATTTATATTKLVDSKKQNQPGAKKPRRARKPKQRTEDPQKPGSSSWLRGEILGIADREFKTATGLSMDKRGVAPRRALEIGQRLWDVLASQKSVLYAPDGQRVEAFRTIAAKFFTWYFGSRPNEITPSKTVEGNRQYQLAGRSKEIFEGWLAQLADFEKLAKQQQEGDNALE